MSIMTHDPLPGPFFAPHYERSNPDLLRGSVLVLVLSGFRCLSVHGLADLANATE